ncbi:SurA N-terminal domain-containing protein [Streptomyces megasporus]|uniref:SurA N-terminal domain-containing protein n=1 Tax=Streptomyces megasporus TaxID=44060 RepID=UPI0004E11D29|nr:SurA N-terminal domain-containing protein [Streptomyces megasporus]
MFRRRTSLSLSAAAAALVVAPLLTACGSDAHAGAAAVVDGERITVSQVQEKVRAVREAQRETGQGAQLIRNTEQLTRGTLHGMVFGRVLEKAAEDAGVKVTRRDVQLAREDAERQLGGAEQLEAMMLQQRAAAPDEVDDMVRVQLLLQKLGERLGADQRTPQGQEKLRTALEEASRDMDVTVNPRYGTWDDEQITLADLKQPWIKEISNPEPLRAA